MELAAYGDITSVVVSRGGAVVAEHYVEGDGATLRNTRSCTKTVLGMLVGLAIDTGHVASVKTDVVEIIELPESDRI
jgi:CubicO group peptidase (beta-lactamase class C family)